MRWLAFALLIGCGRIGFDAIGGPLALAPRDVRTNINSPIAFSATGGRPPYSFSVDVGLGAIDGAGRFRAGQEPGVAQVSVIDDAGDIDSTTVTVVGDLYVVGGSNGNAGQSTVYTSADGVTWQLAGSLPAGRGWGMLYVYDDAMIYAGGAANTSGGAVYSEIWRTTDGASWTQIGAFSFTLDCAAHAVFRGAMWMIGGAGSDGGFGTTIMTSVDGATWTVQGTAPLGLHCGALVVYRDRLWLIGGHAAAGQSAAAFVSDDGLTWTQVTPLPAGGEYHAVGVFDDRLWVAGGTGLLTRVVWTQDGAVWTDAAPFNLARTDAMLTTIDQQLWVVGGIPQQTLSSPNGNAWAMPGMFPVGYSGSRLARFTPK